QCTVATHLASLTTAKAALRIVRTNLGEVFAPGVDLVEGDPGKAMRLLTDAYRAVDDATAASVPAATLDPLRARARRGLPAGDAESPARPLPPRSRPPLSRCPRRPRDDPPAEEHEGDV